MKLHIYSNKYMGIYIYAYRYICTYVNFVCHLQKCHVSVNIYIKNQTFYIYIYKHINFSQIFRLFSKPSTVCVDKALDEKFTNTAEIKN